MSGDLITCLMLSLGCMVVILMAGYLAACAGAERWLNFFDWLLLRDRKEATK